VSKYPPRQPIGWQFVEADYDDGTFDLSFVRDDGYRSHNINVFTAVVTNLRARQVALNWFLKV